MKKDEDEINFIFRVLEIALLEIRQEAYKIKNSKIYLLSDLIHNLPSAICQEIKSENVNLKEVLRNFENRSQDSDISFWVENIKEQTIPSIPDDSRKNNKNNTQ